MTDRTITVEATGEVTAQTDIVTVRLEAAGRAETQTAANRAAEDRVASVRDAIRDLDLPSDLQRHEATVRHKSSLFNTDEDDPTYRATIKCELTCRASQTTEVFLTVGDAGGDVLSMDYALAPERRDALHEEALTAATERARQEAEAIAEAEALTIGEVQSVEHVNSDGMSSIVEEALADIPSESVEFGDLTISASVEATYAIEA